MSSARAVARCRHEKTEEILVLDDGRKVVKCSDCKKVFIKRIKTEGRRVKRGRKQRCKD